MVKNFSKDGAGSASKMVQTEIGLLPEDWEVKRIAEISKPVRGGSPRPAGSPLYFNGNFIPWLTVASLTNISKSKIYVTTTESCLTELGSHYSRNLKKGTLIISNSGATLGVAKILDIDCCANDGIAALLELNANNKFITYFINTLTEHLRNNIATGNGQPNLNTDLIGNLLIPLPPLPEQEAIAEALSDADAWIESLEQLIAKKRLIKQGAMQELLTPKEDWEEKTIFEVADKKRDLFNDGDWIEAVHIKEEGIRLIQTGNIGVGRFLNKNSKKYISEKSFVELKCKEIVEGDLLICRLAEPAGRVCIFPKTEDLKSVTSVDVTIYRPDENIFDRRILLYLLSTDEWFKQVLEQVGGTTHKRISRGNLGNIKIKIPKSLTEQTRIATILSDMDAELEALEGQLGKARKVKQGMMQELLTGRVRLV